MPPSVALVVRCFNEEAHIGRLLTGALRQTVVPHQIVVVDSGSTDATLAIAAAFNVSTVSIAPARFSFGHALNIGLDKTDCDIAILASAHVYPVYETWIEHLIEPMAEPCIALTYGRQQIPLGGRFSEQRLLEQWFPAQSVRRQPHPFCNNANAAVRRSVWESQRYDEQLTGLEDLDWARKAMEAGYHVGYVAEAPVVHVHDESFRQVVSRYQREAIAHKNIYNEQEMGASAAARLALSHIVSDLFQAGRVGGLRANAADIARFRSAQFLGTWRGFAQSGPVTELLRRRFYYPSRSHTSVTAPKADGLGRAIDYDEPLASS